MSRQANQIRKVPMKKAVMVALVLSISGLSPAFAQIGTMPTTPTLGATTPLGIGPTTPVGGTGIPLGATEIAKQLKIGRASVYRVLAS